MIAQLALIIVLGAGAQASDELLLEAVRDQLTFTHVYVHPDVENSADTAAILEARLRPDDSLNVVMLPEGAASEAFAEDAGHAIDRRTVVLAVGAEVFAWSNALPAGVADDLLAKAASVGVTPLDTITTFMQNVHDYQYRPVARKPPVEDGGWPWWVATWLVLAAIGIGAGARWLFARKITNDSDLWKELHE